MSTTFGVYTPTTTIPSFDEVLSLSNRNLKEALDKHGIDKIFKIDVSMRKNKTNDFVDFDKLSPAKWPQDEYAWFTVTGSLGGCDAYYDNVNDCSNMEFWNDEFILNKRRKKLNRK